MDIKLVAIDELMPHPKNPNKHSKEQIDRLAKLIAHHGFRAPIVVSNQSGFIIAGHGRLQAAKKLSLENVPVVYQDFASTEDEYAYLVSDNAIASWSELDLSAINNEILNFGPDFDLDLLGLENFTVDLAEREIEIKEKELDENIPTENECPSCGYKY